MAELRAGLAEVAAWQGKAGGRISVGAMPLSRARWLPEAIARFSARHPQIDIAVHEGSYAELAGPLRDGDIDMTLGALRDETLAPDLTQTPVFEDHLALIMRAGHPFLAQTDTMASAILAYPWLMPSRDTPLRRYWETMMRALGHGVPHVGIECGSVLMIRQLLLAGDALTLLSPDQVAVELAAGLLAAVPPPLPVQRTIGITTRTGWRPTAAQAEFVALLHEVGTTMA
jgi:LysR family transcriptional regulator, regulator for genes of the gallate degradation pathway